MLELGCELRSTHRSVYVTFSEGGHCRDFVATTQAEGFDAFALKSDFPRLVSALSELTQVVQATGASVLCPHGYKSNILGLAVARRLRRPNRVGFSRLDRRYPTGQIV